MRRSKQYLFLTFLLVALLTSGESVLLHAQPLSFMRPSIGLDSLPGDAAPTCSMRSYGTTFENSGFAPDALIPDFTLYTVNGVAVNALTELSKGKPMLLVAGSYTCPFFREKIAKLNELYDKYKNEVTILVVYTLEAHPIVDNSPYSDTVWVPSQNYSDNVLYRQPTTYGGRVTMAKTLLSKITIKPTLVVDGPCNEWWWAFGKAPNNAFLIDTLGHVYVNHGWFNRAPRNMSADIDSMLKGVRPSEDPAAPKHGSFTLVNGQSLVQGVAGTEISDSCILSNKSSAPVVISVVRRLNILPAGWKSAITADVSYPPSVDTLRQYLDPGESIPVYIDFATNYIPGSASVTLDFINADSAANNATHTFKAVTGTGNLHLKPSIGLQAAPAPSDAVCAIARASTNFGSAGLKVGDTIPDFTLYTLDGASVNAFSELAMHKPLLLVAGSYTSPSFRNQLAKLNELCMLYPNSVATYVVYTAESNPIVDDSPFSDSVWVTSQNYGENVLYRQPTTYGKRVDLANAMTAHTLVRPTILVDGPCNEWWKAFGPAPNNAYLIDTLGRVFSKHGEFNVAPRDMKADIDSLLRGGKPINPDDLPKPGGRFVITGSIDTVRGVAGATLRATTTVKNPTTHAVRVIVSREPATLPKNWSTALSTTVAYPPSVNALQLYLKAGESIDVHLDFATSLAVGSTVVMLLFTNSDSVANKASVIFHASTDPKRLPLKSSIGLNAVPQATDAICAIAHAGAPFDSVGFRVGDTIPDFTLYTLDGARVNANDELIKGKPMLLVAGSFTSPEWREQRAALNAIYTAHSKDVSIYAVYVPESNPVIDTSPYSNTVWVPSPNYRDTVFCAQAKTYGERVATARMMTLNREIKPTILIDGPCNTWWKTFGPAPNNAYLIDTLGRVYAKHGWFNRAPRNMMADIDSLLKGAPPYVPVRHDTVRGRFTYAHAADTVRGRAGDVLVGAGLLSNPSANPVTITIQRTANALPPGWTSSMCTDICYPPFVDVMQQYLTAGSSIGFTLDVATTSTPGTGVVTIDFINVDSTANRASHTFRIVSITPTGVGDDNWASPESLSMYPQPVTRGRTLTAHGAVHSTLTVFDLLGRIRLAAILGSRETTISTSTLTEGVYRYVVQAPNGKTQGGTIVVE